MLRHAMASGHNSLLETVLLIGATATLLLAGYPGAIALLVLVSLWFVRCARGRERWLTGLFLLAALGLVAYDAFGRSRSLDPDRKLDEIRQQFSELWEDLDSRAATAASELEGWETGTAESPDPFGVLVALAGDTPSERTTYLLVDPGGVVRAWAGAGLLHDLEQLSLPASGRSFRLGFQSVTIFSVARIRDGGNSGRVVVGRSAYTGDLLERDRLLGPIRWSVFEPGAVVPEELHTVELGGGPRIAVEDWTLGARPLAGLWESRPRRWGAVALALALIALALLRPATGLQRPTLLAIAAVAAALAARLDLATGSLLVSAVWLGAFGWRAREPSARVVPPMAAAAIGVASTGVIAAVAWWTQREYGPLDLGSSLFPGLEPFAWRLTTFALTLGWIGWLLGRGDREPSRPSQWWPPMGFVALLSGAAFHDVGLGWVLTAVAVAAACLAIWVSDSTLRLRPSSAVALGIAAALLATLTWEGLYRHNLKYHLNSVVLPSLAPPEASELARMRRSLDRHFGEIDLATLALPNPAGLDPQDLGLALWRDSPLAVRGALSAISARVLGAPHSSFSFGLPLTNEGDVDWSPTRWRKVEEPSPEGRVAAGTTRLFHSGRPWGELSYTLLMRPGFELATERIGNYSAGLLRGAPGPFRPSPEAIRPALYGLYDRQGMALEPAVPGLRLPLDSLVQTPGYRFTSSAGAFAGFAAVEPEAVRVLLLPMLGPAGALERVGTHAVSLLLVLGLAGGFAWLCALRGPPTGAALSAVFRSYSKRMLVVTGLLLLVPILLLNTFALGVIGEHLHAEERRGGEAALLGAQRVLGEYILALEPGFGVESVLDDELLGWLSRVVQNDINLYWGSSVYASSKSELFSAGVLPKRIPGEIFQELVLGEAKLASRVNRAGSTDYLELYAPVAIPGQDRSATRLFVSVPLLAQEAETATELASLRRKVLLATAALVVLLLAVGIRLARGFTAPLMEIVNGTQRIADGAASIELAPTDTELATLVEAIDRMAQRIDTGRRRLVREKALVERVIDNVNSGVVSVDRRGRVLLLNQVARNLLDAEVGDSLEEVLELSERLTPVSDFVRESGDEARLETVRLTDPEGDEAEWSLVWVPLRGEGDPEALFVVEDVTEVLRGQRLEAWAEMARIIAHEIKNPLTPIRLSAEHMREVHAERPQEFDRVFERCTHNILEQVDELQQISTEFSAYSRLPKIEPQVGDLGQAVRRIVDGYRAAEPERMSLEVADGLEEVVVAFDTKLIGRALRNLLENALRAAADGARVDVKVESDGERASIRVLDRGPGVDPELLQRIFDPYFSTHDAGTGLGLPIARRIAEEHGGGIQARNRDTGGLEVELWLPAGGPVSV